MKRTDKKTARKILLIISLVCNLGLLGFFKYYNFFIGSLAPLLNSFGFKTGTLSIILPVGISFYTFQTLSYTIDVYRNKLEPCDNFFDFALFVAFFPQLVAGPIVRASVFLPQLKTKRQLTLSRFAEGSKQFIIGLFKKAFIADNIAFFVDFVFKNVDVFDGATVWLAVLAYSIQIYCDFSGYSDMAIGISRILGYDLPVNFNYPYLAKSVTEFWQRWHISLSTWLRDYLYIPLGGNRKGRVRTYINLLITMILGGLWHGAAWTFVLWGVLHGVALAINKGFRELFGNKIKKTLLYNLVSWCLTFLVVIVGWVLFRSTNWGVSQAASVLNKMFVNVSNGFLWIHPFTLFAIALMASVHILQITRFKNLRELSINKWYTPIILFIMLWLIVLFPSKEFEPFIYFQF